MRVKELQAVLDILRRVLSRQELRPDLRKDLLKAERELKKLRSAGKLDKRRVFRATKLIAEALRELLDDSDKR